MKIHSPHSGQCNIYPVFNFNFTQIFLVMNVILCMDYPNIMLGWIFLICMVAVILHRNCKIIPILPPFYYSISCNSFFKAYIFLIFTLNIFFPHRSWSGNENAKKTIDRAMARNNLLQVTMPHAVSDISVVSRAVDLASGSS